MRTIAVLMSTYNGERYVEEQISSIFNQDYDTSKWQLKLYVRDDQSTDNTQKIIQKLSVKYNISMDFDGPNLGFAKSFYKLLDNIIADYYFFADQDDIWLSNKLSLFLDRFMEIEKKGEKNIGVFSDALVANENAESLGKRLLEARSPRIHSNKLSFFNQLFEFYAQGASMAVNRNIVEKLLFLPFTELPFKESHDHFIGLVVSFIGCMSYIDEPTLLYRQSGSNVYGARKNTNQNIIKKIKSISSRVDTVETLLLSAELVSGILSPLSDSNVHNELQKLNQRKDIKYAIKFFIKYREYVSLAHPIAVSLLYSLYFSPNTSTHKQIRVLIDRKHIYENKLGSTTKL